MGDFLTSATSWSARRRTMGSRDKLLNVLRSILVDTSIVEEVLSFLAPWGIKLYGNMRNGAWYHSSFDGMCYFKSTDGHHGRWHFSLQRLNLDLMRGLSENGRIGVVIVDSTKAGKRFPDSFSATVPIWCAVLNYIMMTTAEGDDRVAMAECLCTPDWISGSSRDQMISACLENVKSLPKSAVESIKNACVGEGEAGGFKPLCPVWVAPDEDGSIEWTGQYADELLETLLRSSTDRAALPFTPVILLSVSGKRNSVNYGGQAMGTIALGSSGEVTNSGGGDYTHESLHSWVYVPGAGDDEEAWSQGLTPRLFWANKERLFHSEGGGLTNQELERRVAGVLAREKEGQNCGTDSGGGEGRASRVEVAEGLCVSRGRCVPIEVEDVIIISVVDPSTTSTEERFADSGETGVEAAIRGYAVKGAAEMELFLSCDKQYKRHAHRWGDALSACLAHITAATGTRRPEVVVSYSLEQSFEAAAAVVVAILCSLEDAEEADRNRTVTGTGACEEDATAKSTVRVRLGAVQTAMSRLFGSDGRQPHPPRWVVREVASFVAHVRTGAGRDDQCEGV